MGPIKLIVYTDGRGEKIKKEYEKGLLIPESLCDVKIEFYEFLINPGRMSTSTIGQQISIIAIFPVPGGVPDPELHHVKMDTRQFTDGLRKLGYHEAVEKMA